MRLEMDCGLASSSINKWDNKRPSADKLKAVADYFHVSMEYILTGKEKQPSVSEGLSEKDQRLIEWFRSLPEEKQQAILILQGGPSDAL